MCIKWKLLALCLASGLAWCGLALAAGSTPNPTIDEVWMRHGGARLYYDALSQPTQMDMQGMRRKDPALIRNLPPITEVKPQPTRRSSRAAVSVKPTGKTVAPATTGLPAGQSTSTKPAVKVPSDVKLSPAVAPRNGQRAPAAGGNGTQGALQPTQNKDDVFVPPPKTERVMGATSAFSGASTSSMGNGGRTAGNGQTSGVSIPAGARP